MEQRGGCRELFTPVRGFKNSGSSTPNFRRCSLLPTRFPTRNFISDTTRLYLMYVQRIPRSMHNTQGCCTQGFRPSVHNIRSNRAFETSPNRHRDAGSTTKSFPRTDRMHDTTEETLVSLPEAILDNRGNATSSPAIAMVLAKPFSPFSPSILQYQEDILHHRGSNFPQKTYNVGSETYPSQPKFTLACNIMVV